MSPGPENDEAPGRHQGQSSSSSSTHKVQPAYVYAEVRHVTGRHRNHLKMFVRCPGCGGTHCHMAPVEFLSGKRTAACGLRYVVVAGLARAVAA